MAEDVYCTLLMSDSYLPGAAVLARSLRDCGTTKKLAVLVTIDSLLAATIAELKELFDYVIPVTRLANPTLENLLRLDRLDLRFAFTKIGLWRQEQFRKIVYIDSDVVALRAPDELFDLDADFAAAPDIGWPDIFNSGVMVLKPSMSEYWSMHTLASSGTSFDGADQGLFNEYFGNRPWHRLSFAYNCTPSSGYQYEPAYRHFRSSINMVHFIGKEKPWTQGREALSSNSSSVYKELLGSWWAVYDRHYRAFQTPALGQLRPGIKTVQQYVKGEQRQNSITWATGGVEPREATTNEPPEASAVRTEPPMTEADKDIETIDHFSAPQMDWDATRSEPPVESRPEASNFPSQRYEMSHDHGLFRAPLSYPAPPKDVGYQIPSTKPAVYERPKAIFPWEQTAKTPTRVFADEPPQSPPGIPTFVQTRSTATQSGVSPTLSSVTQSPSTPSIKVMPEDPWQTFTRTNAWDDDNSIDRYVRAMKQVQQRRGNVQVIHQAEPVTASKDFATSPASPPIAKRRESLILTDFPTEVERPSLPVTPAPIQRRTFWGEERDDEGNLPGAEGVPEQAHWNPIERLEELRRTSVIATGEMPLSPGRTMPSRAFPESSSGLGSSPPVSSGAMATGVPQGVPLQAAPSFVTPNFSAGHSTFTGNRLDPNVDQTSPTFHDPLANVPQGEPSSSTTQSGGGPPMDEYSIA